jgi:hypothetical protein
MVENEVIARSLEIGLHRMEGMRCSARGILDRELLGLVVHGLLGHREE